MAHLNPQEVAAYLNTIRGQPWERKGLHCWRLVVKLQRDLFGRAIPFGERHMVNRTTLSQYMNLDCVEYGWVETDTPVHGAVVRMYRQGSEATELLHAGVVLDLGGPLVVIHTDNPHGVVFDTLAQLTVQRGWVPRFFIPDAGAVAPRE